MVGASQSCPSSSTQISLSTLSFEKTTTTSLQLSHEIPPFSESFGPFSPLPGVTSDAADLLELFFDPNVINHIIEQINLYARQNPSLPSYEWEDCTPDKLVLFRCGNPNGTE